MVVDVSGPQPDTRTLLKTGLAGTAVTALCCFTPLLVVIFGLLGITSWLGWIDWVLLPALGLFVGLTVYALLATRRRRAQNAVPVLRSTLTCPACGRTSTETMPTDACQYFYDCPGCGEVLRPLPGDCCVFCSYGDVPCPPKQATRAGDTGMCCH